MKAINTLRMRRLEAKLTQQMVATALGIDQTAVSQWESGDAKPRADKLPMLAKLYNCTIDELFEEETTEA